MSDIIEIGPARFRNFIRKNIHFSTNGMHQMLAESLAEERKKFLADFEIEKKITIERFTKEQQELAELVAEKKRLDTQLNEKIKRKEAALNRLIENCSIETQQKRLAWALQHWPAVPFEKSTVVSKGENLPAESGIYFLWINDTVDYVGQSVNLRQRVALDHEKVQLLENPSVSFLLFPKDELYYAECYYIGLLKPRLNGRGQL